MGKIELIFMWIIIVILCIFLISIVGILIHDDINERDILLSDYSCIEIKDSIENDSCLDKVSNIILNSPCYSIEIKIFYYNNYC